MKKILFTASTYSHIRSFHLPYIRRFQEEGFSVHVACASPPEQIPGADEVIPLPFEKSMSSPSNFAAARQLRRRIRAEGYSLICTHTSLAAFFTRLALTGLRGRPPLVNMVHGYLFDDETPALRRSILLAAERLTAPQTDLLLTMNAWDHAAALKWKLGSRVFRVPGIGVDFSRLDSPALSRESLGIAEDSFVMLYAAEFSARKSQETLIRAMQKLPERAVLVLPGRGALLERCRELAESLGLGGRVVFPGWAEDIGAWYRMADIAVTSSRSEGLPFNVMEAVYCGLPVLASAVKGHTDLIHDGHSGLLFPYGDADAFAAQALRLMESEELRAELAGNAAGDIMQYGLDAVLPVVMEQYLSSVPDAERVPAYSGG